MHALQPWPHAQHGKPAVSECLAARLHRFLHSINSYLTFMLGPHTKRSTPGLRSAPCTTEPRHTFTFGLYIAQVNATSSEAGASSSLVSPIPSSRRSFLIVSTGQGAGRVLSDTWALDVSGGTWRRLPDNGDAPQPRYGSAGTVPSISCLVGAGMHGACRRVACVPVPAW